MKSKLRPLGRAGLRLEMPTTSQPADKKASMAATPMRPLAPATSTLFLMVIPVPEVGLEGVEAVLQGHLVSPWVPGCSPAGLART
jgi:hypothetical protein